jgi:hypothetical protein
MVRFTGRMQYLFSSGKNKCLLGVDGRQLTVGSWQMMVEV